MELFIAMSGMKKVPVRSRMGFFPSVSKRSYIHIENTLYYLAEKYSADYNGGYWEFYEAKKTGVRFPVMDKALCNVVNPENYFSEKMEGWSYSLALWLLLLSNLSYKEEQLGEQYHALREWLISYGARLECYLKAAKDSQSKESFKKQIDEIQKIFRFLD